MDHPSPGHTTRQVSVTEASRELGISPETVRRWIKSGRLEARRAIRPQGTVWEVALPPTTPRGVPPVTPVTGHSEASLSEPEQAPPDETWHPSLPLAHHTGDAASLVASIARLIVELAEVRVISDRRADQLFSMSETIGRQSARVDELERETVRITAELVASRTPQAAPAGQPASTPPEPSSEPPAPRWRSYVPWLLAAWSTAAAVALLLVPR